MKRIVAVLFALVLLGSFEVALGGGDMVKSGPQVGEMLPGPFHPLNVTGPWEGKKHCLYCEYAGNPVAMVFARTVTPELTKLIKQIDAATGKNKGASMGSFVVFLNGEEKLAKQLQDLAAKEGIKNTVLSVDHPVGPEEYKVAKKADVTVVLYVEDTVKSNFTYAKGQLNDQAITQIVADLPKILPKK